MGTLLSHVEYLSETIGPRAATTDAEHQAAEYLRDCFESRGLETEVQAFDSPRTYAWAYVLYHLLTIIAAVGCFWYPWPALALAAIVAAVMRLDLDTRWGLSSLMPKGPSQNVIARHQPRVGRGERVQRVVIVAHYDSARASLAFSPGLVKNFSATFGLMKACTVAVPVVIVIRMLPYVNKLPATWTWYAVLASAAYLLVPLLINVHRELFMKFTPGANDNASGVAAMLGVMERMIPEPDAATMVARENAKMRTESDAWGADVVPDGAVLAYSPSAAPARPAVDSWTDDEELWTDTGAGRGQTAMGFDGIDRVPATPPTPRPAPADDLFDDEPQATVNAPTPDPDLSAKLFGTGAIMTRPVASGSDQYVPAPARPASPSSFDTAPARRHAPDLGFDVDFEDASPRRSPSGMPHDAIDDDLFGGAPVPGSTGSFPAVSDTDTHGAAAPAPVPAPRPPEREKRGLFGGRKKSDTERHGVRDWLGVGNDFDARKQGRDIGSWENFPEDDTEDSGWKGGSAAGAEGLDDPDFASSEAARIRRRVTTAVDRELVEKEVWFVATGAEEVGTVGMKAFLKEFEPDLRDAVILNLDNLGTGAVAYVTREGMAKRYFADRRLAGAAKRAAREAGLPVKGREYRGLSTDATPALARGFRAMSVMAFDINDRLPNWHWKTDTADNVSEQNLETAVDFVTALIKEL
ncbi:MAG: M28 family peptidase [Coriobacteriia bacterium]|nr:M28 family peptidase [Coriobacteriia bacterium]